MADKNKYKVDKMKKGSLVMFSNANSRYAKWFLGRVGSIVTDKRTGSYKHVRVRWLEPVSYYGDPTSFSDFPTTDFTLIC